MRTSRIATGTPNIPGMTDPLADSRTDYLAGALADDAPPSPSALLGTWMQEALDRHEQEGDLPDPTAAVLSTVALDADGSPRPRSRTVLVKGLGEDGDALTATLYTNRDSAKGRELAAVPRAALLLPWYALQRQVRIEGTVAPLDDDASDAYFARRPRASQLGAWASRQSAPIPSRAELEAQLAEAAARFEGADVPRPPFWGGYRVTAERVEFWQGRSGRLHDRIAYALGAGGWTRERLQP